MALNRWLTGCYMQCHIYINAGSHPHLEIWTLRNEEGWQDSRKYLHPEDQAQVEQGRRILRAYAPSETGL